MVQELQLERFYAARGIELITPEAGTQILGRVLGQPPAHLIAITADWTRAREAAPAGSLPAMFSALGQPGKETADQAADDTAALLAAVEQAPPAERPQVAAGYLRGILGHVLQLEQGTFSDDEALTNLGMDSMMAIEIKHRVEVVTGQDLSVLELLQGMSIASMADRVVGALRFGPGGEEAGETDGGHDAAPPEMAPDELERLIAETPAELLEQLLAELDSPPTEQSQELTK
jgi:hypothetical protein